MTPIKKYWVQFRKEDAKDWNKVRFANGTEIEIITDYNPAEYTCEIGVLVGVPQKEKFFKKGDTVLLHYDVFTRGKYQHLAKEEIRTFAKQETEGFLPDIYFCEYSEILGKIEGDKLVSPPERTLVKPLVDSAPPITSSILHLPDTALVSKKDALIKSPYWGEVVSTTRDDLQPGDTVFCTPANFVPMYYKTRDPYNLLCVYNDSIMLKRTAK